jgi:hypothetical protein
LASWAVRKSETIASVVSEGGLFQVTMNFVAVGMDTMAVKMTLRKSEYSSFYLEEVPLVSNIVLALEDVMDLLEMVPRIFKHRLIFPSLLL